MSDIDLSQLPDFIIEATEHLEEMEALLLQLVENRDDLEILNEIFRPVHTIKGSAQFIGVARVSKLTHRLEDLMDKLRDGSMASTAAIVETLISAKDRISQLVKELESTQEEKSQVDDLIETIEAILNGEQAESVSDNIVTDTSRDNVADDGESSSYSNSQFDEEHDKELFSIYLNQVKTQINKIKSKLSIDDASENTKENIPIFTEAVSSVKSSSNYMGYNEVCELLDKWLRELKDASNKILLDQDASLEFMQHYLTEIETLFPDISENTTDKKAEDNTQEREVETATEDTNNQYNEEGDDELFKIFITQLQHEVSNINSILKIIENSDDKDRLLDKCIEIVSKLTSSANYMGYEELSEFYVGWADTMLAAAKSLAKGKDVSTAFLSFYLSEINQFFPQIDIEAVTKSTDKNETLADIVEPVSPSTETEEVINSEDEKDQREQTTEDESEIFAQLSDALDGTIHDVSDTEYQALNSIFDVMVSTEDTANKSAIETTKKNDKRTKKSRRATTDRRLDERRFIEDRRRERDSQEKKTKRSIRVDSDKIDTLMNQVGELVVDRSYFVQLLNELGELQSYFKENLNLEQKELKMMRTFNYRLAEAISGLGRTSNELQEGVMKMRMLPISQIFNRYPRLVHDLTNNTDKKVNLIVKGEETELDKMIVEELSDPLIHIIRNAVDHGIETMDDRRQTGKQAEASLMLQAYQESNNIVIEVTDDGRGINKERIKQKAIEKGLYSEEDISRMSASEITNIILTAGFSTADKVSNTSGRGVGMDVVRKNIEKLNGSLEIDSKAGVGTRMRIKIPLTLAIIHALMIRTGKDIFAIPLANVDETVRVDISEISTVEGVEVIYLRGQTLPVFRLSSLFKIPSDQNNTRLYVVIVSSGGQRVGFVVDEMMGQDEVVIKPLVDYVQDKSGFSGATIIGDGRISLILDVYELVGITAERQAQKHREQTKRLKQKIHPKKINT